MKRVGLFFIVMIVGLMVVLVYNKSVVIEVTDELIKTCLRSSDTDEFDNACLTKESWNQEYLFQSYTSRQLIDVTLGKKLNFETQIVLSDQIVLFAFMKDKRVVRYAEVPREFVEFELESKI